MSKKPKTVTVTVPLDCITLERLLRIAQAADNPDLGQLCADMLHDVAEDDEVAHAHEKPVGAAAH